jgi:hypothetical protein
MDYQIIPNLTYLNRPVYTRNPAVTAAANAAPVNAVPYNNDDDSDEEDEPENLWDDLGGIRGGKKRTRKHLSKNKRNSRKRRKTRRV